MDDKGFKIENPGLIAVIITIIALVAAMLPM